MLIDEVTLKLKAGNGGNGGVYFQRIKLSLGPTGADGGNGGAIWFEGVADIGALSQFRNKRDVHAENGHNGKAQFNDGRRGEDVVLRVPIGTVIHFLDTGAIVELAKIGERVLAVKGGRGGRGNFKFRASTNTSPKQFELGGSGQEATVRLELKLIADVGLVGIPSAGKSSLLNKLTNASAKVGNYPFTTLEPNLGVYFDLVIADIPGLIEGASQGKGLGIKFLRHVERTRVLFHLISAESDDPVRDWRTIVDELAAYDPRLAEKQEYVFLSKIDMSTPEEIEKKLAQLRIAGVSAQTLSVIDPIYLKEIKTVLNDVAKNKHVSNEEK